MPYEDVLYEVRDGVAWIIINRPEVRNAFRTKTVDELIAAFRVAWQDDEVGVVVLTGAGDKAFSAGGDQRERGTGGYSGAGGIRMDGHGPHGGIRGLPQPVTALVNGFPVGGGPVLPDPCQISIRADPSGIRQHR